MRLRFVLVIFNNYFVSACGNVGTQTETEAETARERETANCELKIY
jgi:hypothetical protein